MESSEILTKLKSMRSRKNIEGMAKTGINTKNALGVPIPALRNMSLRIGKDHEIAQKLWDSKIHEARLLASLVEDPDQVSERQIERWVRELDSWDLCDQLCSNLLCATAFPWVKAVEWSGRQEEYVKRAGYVLMAVLSVHDKQAHDERFEIFFPLVKRGATDERNYVRKAVSWALRQMGKRDKALNKKALDLANELCRMDSKSAIWIGRDALRDLSSEAVRSRLGSK